MLKIRKIKAALAREKKTAGEGRAGLLIAMLQRKTADYLNRKTAGWSPVKLKIILILFCLVAGNISLFIASKAIWYANGPPKQFKVQRLNIPPSVIPLPGKPKVADSIK